MARNNYYSVTCSLIFGIIGIVFCEDEARMNMTFKSMLEYLEINPDSVSKLELVEMDFSKKLHKRQLIHSLSMHIGAFNNEIDFVLRPRDSFLASNATSVHIAHYASGNVNDVAYERIVNPFDGVGILYEDPKHMASMILDFTDSGRTTVNGNFRSPNDNARAIVRSLPDNMVHRPTQHLVMKLENDDFGKYPIDDFIQLSSRSQFGQFSYLPTTNMNTNDRVIDTIYPEILVHVHASISSDWSRHRFKAFLEYILTFWNAVDLICRDVENPKVRISIAAIVIAADPRATPYIWYSTYGNNNTLYDIDSTMEKTSRFYYSVNHIFPVESFDVAITMSKLQGIHLGDVTKPVKGWAFTGQACLRNHTDRKHSGVSLTYDNGGYLGVMYAAHELGHLLGLYHEIHETHTDCPTQTGFLMDAILTNSENVTTLSICSRNDLRKTFQRGYLKCMYDEPWRTGTILPGSIAGKPIDLDAVCRAFDHGPSRIPPAATANPCATLWCVSKFDESIYHSYNFVIPPGTSFPIANGAPPGICYRNRCIKVRRFL